MSFILSGLAEGNVSLIELDEGDSMTTINQLIRKGRRKPKKKVATRALQGAPQKR
jgi:hypothetical protein